MIRKEVLFKEILLQEILLQIRKEILLQGVFIRHTRLSWSVHWYMWWQREAKTSQFLVDPFYHWVDPLYHCIRRKYIVEWLKPNWRVNENFKWCKQNVTIDLLLNEQCYYEMTCAVIFLKKLTKRSCISNVRTTWIKNQDEIFWSHWRTKKMTNRAWQHRVLPDSTACCLTAQRVAWQHSVLPCCLTAQCVAWQHSVLEG